VTTLTIGQLAKKAGVRQTTLRYYERRGLLPEPERRDSGYRAYDADNIARIQFIRNAQQLGFSLEEIKELLDLRLEPGVTCANVRHKGEAKLAEIEEKIRVLRSIHERLSALLDACAGDYPLRQCSVLDALEKGE
jgi:MerR family copper efflux transcriptional regulator